MKYYIQDLEQKYNEQRNLFNSLMDGGVYDRDPQRQKEDQQRLKNLMDNIIKAKEAVK